MRSQIGLHRVDEKYPLIVIVIYHVIRPMISHLCLTSEASTNLPPTAKIHQGIQQKKRLEFSYTSKDQHFHTTTRKVLIRIISRLPDRRGRVHLQAPDFCVAEWLVEASRT